MSGGGRVGGRAQRRRGGRCAGRTPTVGVGRPAGRQRLVLLDGVERDDRRRRVEAVHDVGGRRRFRSNWTVPKLGANTSRRSSGVPSREPRLVDGGDVDELLRRSVVVGASAAIDGRVADRVRQVGALGRRVDDGERSASASPAAWSAGIFAPARPRARSARAPARLRSRERRASGRCGAGRRPGRRRRSRSTPGARSAPPRPAGGCRPGG